MHSSRWTRSDGAARRVVDFVGALLGIAGSVAFVRATEEGTTATLVWSAVLSFYFLFYRRVCQVAYWSADTYREFRRDLATRRGSTDDDRRGTPPQEPALAPPLVHILIASYEAADSLPAVLRAIANLDYPAHRVHAWVITEHGERLAAKQRRQGFVAEALEAVRPDRLSIEAFTLLWIATSSPVSSLAEWVDAVVAGSLGLRLTSVHAPTLLIQDLLSRLLREEDAGVPPSERIAGLGLSRRDASTIEHSVRTIQRDAERVSADFVRLLGSAGVYPTSDIAAKLMSGVALTARLQRIGRELCRRWARDETEAPRLAHLRATAEWLFPSTQEVVERTVDELPGQRIRLLDPHNRGFKPGALNVAYRTIAQEGLLDDPAETLFLIIDSDSLLPRHALRAVHDELGALGRPTPIMQMASVPTANFFTGGWYSRFIGLADAIGAVGKWARSTRRRIKPDLHAGSGVVVPAPIAVYIAENRGAPWTETTLTEDARLIVGQFGLMNGARNRTSMVPSYLLEAVPEERGFWSTYVSFWNQRRRWTTGGYDEFFYMATAPRWLLSARWDDEARRWHDAGPERGWNAVAVRLRQAARTLTWAWDHFWWGIGGAIVFTHWWLISVAVAAPSGAMATLGLVALLAAPMVFIVLVGRHVATFIPGGLGWRTVSTLYPLSFVSIWLYALPVVVTQLACMSGLRARFMEWKPTRKPRYEFRIDPPSAALRGRPQEVAGARVRRTAPDVEPSDALPERPSVS